MIFKIVKSDLPMSNPVSLRREGDLAVIVIDNPPVNALGMAVRVGLLELVKRTDADPSIKAVILIGAGRTFVAGADIREFGRAIKGPSGRACMEAVEASKKPFIAALHGHALGGGLELALCAHYRVALPSTRVGLPEVKIGVLPGAGGTQRLPRLVGVESALELMTSGQLVDADKALQYGIIDDIIEGEGFDELLAGALAFARKLIDEKRPLMRVREFADKITDVDLSIFRKYRHANATKWKGLLAQWKIVDLVEAACTQSFEYAYALEDKAFHEVKDSPQRSALTHLFFAEREAAKIPGISGSVKPAPIASVAIIGAGTMGGGIAMAFANSGICVKQLEISQQALQRGRSMIKKNYEISVSRGSMSQTKADEAFARITGVVNYRDIADCDLVIEAAFENMEIKQEIFATLDQVMNPDAVLATNTSGLDIDAIAAVTSRPQNVVGTHFFSPAHVMKLLEVVRGAKSSSQTLATAMGLARLIGKVVVLAGNCEGFIGNRILATYGREADFMLEEGALPWQIDDALKAFGLPMGLYLMRDMAGLDVGWRMRQGREATRDKRLRYSTIADRLCELGRFGQKTGSGYYQYQGRHATPDPDVEKLILDVSKELGVKRKRFSAQEIVDRIIIAMVNEGAKIVGEGVAARASDIDVTYVHGYGFPRYHAGPMFWAEWQGLANIHAKVKAYHAEHGVFWTPAPLLAKAAELGNWQAAQAALSC